MTSLAAPVRSSASVDRTRRALLGGTTALALVGAQAVTAQTASGQTAARYGLIGKLQTQPGKRDELIAILLEGVADMPGCLSYIVAKDSEDENGLWISEVWRDQASHQASLALPAVRAAIAKGRPMIVGFSNSVTTLPVGGVGLRD